MNRRINAGDLATKSRAYGLMPQTSPQNRNLATGMADHIHADAGFIRRGRPRGKHNAGWLHGHYVINAKGIVANGFYVSPQIRQEMPQIPCEAVIIIYQNEQDSALLPAG